ncbi:glycosyltransferase family 2 protein [Crassaminicella profunda]|uniref:glycosyltransferase family 2 protein n=1 Tax=Crassaminicella profunda TaxID=1286698 RepID=UPI001CA6FF61|nr:glycosyltransferase family 2 protein [Crassaminicella profunda]QZY56307.1 glycosyltransferase [Crassaminicella profunda]
MCKVSIIMTSYNKPNYVGKAIEAILKQSFKDFELLLMDDNSNEDTQKVIEKYLKDKRIRYFRSDVKNISERTEKNRYAVQINKALSMINGEYISYATDDNIYKPKRLEKMVNFMKNNRKVKICYSSSCVLHLNYEGKLIKNVIRNAKNKLWVASCQVDHCSIMHKADILPIIYEKWHSYWDEDPQFYLIGDARFFWRLNHFWPFYPINEVLDVNYIMETSLHTQIIAEEKSEFIKRLPKQRTCWELRKYLKNLGSDR